MISIEDQTRLIDVVTRDWQEEVKTEAFIAICAGRERGHRIADLVEERTLDFLEKEKFDVAYQHGKDGNRRSRSMGDVWLRSGEPPLFTPINIKAGIKQTGGQPNMVSLRKVTRALLDHEIDSYWLLMIRLEENEVHFIPSVTLVNIFDYLDFMAFDSGPGQIMLKSDTFYAHRAAGGEGTKLTLKDLMIRLDELRRDGDRRLIANREKELAALDAALASFDPSLPITQTGLDLRGVSE